MSFGSINGIFVQPNDANSNGEVVRWEQMGSTRYYKGSVDGTAVAATKIFTTNNQGQSFFPQFIRIITESANTVTIPAIITVGTNGASYNNILTTTTLTSLITTNLFINLPLSLAIALIPANTDVYVNVTTGATAVGLTIGVQVFGDYK